MDGELLRIGRDGIVPVRWDLAKASSDGAGTLTGWASVYSNVDQQDDIVMPGAFRKWLSGWNASKDVVPLTLDHENGARGTIGSVVKAIDRPIGLQVTFRFSSDDEAQRARTRAKEGHIKGLSIFGDIANKSVEIVDGRPIRILREINPLRAVGLTPFPVNTKALVTVVKAIVDKPWDGSASRFTDEQYQRSCLIDRGGDSPVKQRCSLPVREPNGDVNKNALSAAASALAGGRGGLSGVTAEMKSRAARALIRLYSQADMEPPKPLRQLASSVSSSLDIEVLPDLWVADMRSAIAITNESARAVAVKALIADLVVDVSSDTDDDDHGDDSTTDDGADSTSDDDDRKAASLYALGIVGESEPQDGSPAGGPVDINDLLASVDADTTRDELEALEKELRS